MKITEYEDIKFYSNNKLQYFTVENVIRYVMLLFIIDGDLYSSRYIEGPPADSRDPADRGAYFSCMVPVQTVSVTIIFTTPKGIP
jgi:hypothetical protein